MRLAFLPALVVLAAATTAAAPARDAQGGLEATARRFLEAVKRELPEQQAAFFPRDGEWRYVRTSHRADGDYVGVWRFPAAQTVDAIRGPLAMSFDYHHSQTIGALHHQLVFRGTRWRRVPGNRFVPRDAPAESAIYVQWRRESGRWVVDEFGDEAFFTDALPPWCC